tara:strand:+ start:3911 stop:4780 length:870 start_codon:yes stop_codon:yes gene_type:complete
MTKLWVLSDLHQEFCREPSVSDNPHTRFEPALHQPADFTVVVLAGDIDVALDRSLHWAADHFPGVPTIYVPGNHDFYTHEDEPQFTLWEMQDRGHELADRLGIHLLMNGAVEIGDTRIVGATLWTDFASVGTGHQKFKEATAQGRFGMNDYKRIKRPSSIDPTKRKRIRPEDTIREHQMSRAYLEQVLAQEHAGATVVVTHHAPSPQSLDPQFTDLNYCYASRLDLVIEEYVPEVWIHGHIHKAVDYSIGSTRIVSNPRGYQFDVGERDRGFNPGLVLEVPEPAPKLGW